MGLDRQKLQQGVGNRNEFSDKLVKSDEEKYEIRDTERIKGL